MQVSLHSVAVLAKHLQMVDDGTDCAKSMAGFKYCVRLTMYDSIAAFIAGTIAGTMLEHAACDGQCLDSTCC